MKNALSFELDEERKIYYENGSIFIKDPNIGETQSLKLSNVKGVALDCDCGACRRFFYLKDNGELLEVTLDHGELIMDDNNELDKEYIKVVTNNAKYMTLVEVEDPNDTCGGYNLLYIDNNNNFIVK